MDEDNQQDDQNNQSSEVSIGQLQNDLDLANNNWKRALADFENYKRRKEGENKELVEFAREVTVAKLLPTLDSLEQALKHMPRYNLSAPRMSRGAGSRSAGHSGHLPSGGENSVNVRDIGNTAEPPPPSEERDRGEVADDFAKQYQNWQTGVNGIVIQLDKALEELGVRKIESIGKKFNPHFHEAVREVESESDNGIVVDELQTGFELNGKVIRPSQVVVSKKAQV